MQNKFQRLTLAVGITIVSYLGGVATTPDCYESMSMALKKISSNSSRGALDSDREKARDLADKFDLKFKHLTQEGYVREGLVPFLQVFNGDVFEYISIIEKITPNSPKGLPRTR